MPTYITLLRWTHKGAENVKQSPPGSTPPRKRSRLLAAG